jgi:formamidopyrimidine-DNA glycosylase
MPELPEVETTIRGLQPIVNSTILSIKIHTPKLRFFIPKNILRKQESVEIKEIKRRGKLILLNLSNEHTIVMHLGMSGRLRLINNNKFQKQRHDHFILRTNQDHCLIFNDVRKFGFIDCGKIEEIYNKKYMVSLGEEALGINLNDKYLFLKISKSAVAIKQILLDQSIIAGIGNIYASEILFNAKISPLLRGKDLSLEECNQLILSTKKILKKAISAGGSTLRDYVSTDGTVGNYQSNFKVYKKDGQKISGKIIKKIVQYGRSTYFCPDLQKKQKI